jgi:hypothetical protein
VLNFRAEGDLRGEIYFESHPGLLASKVRPLSPAESE